MEFSSDGLVVGGIECSFQKGELRQDEDVFDLVGWVRKHFLKLSESWEKHYQKGSKLPNEAGFIWIGKSVNPFAMISVKSSKFVVYYIHPEYRDKKDWCLEFADIEKVSVDIATKALKVKDLTAK